MQALIPVILFLAGLRLSGRAEGGYFAALAFFANHDLATRASMFPPLRENASLVFLLVQSFFLALALQKPQERPAKIYRGAVFFSTLLHLLSWQFAPSTLLMQFFALSVLHCLGVISWEELEKMRQLVFGAALTAAVFLLGNPLLLSSIYFLLLLTLFVLAKAQSKLTCLSPGSFTSFRGKVASWTGIYALVLLLKFLSIYFFKLDDDAHFFSFLYARLMGEVPSYEILVYFCSSPFQALQRSTLLYLTLGGVLPAAVLGAAFICFFALRSRTNERHTFAAALLAQSLVFSIPMLLIHRMVILALPFLCLLSAAVWQRLTSRLSRWTMKAVCLLIYVPMIYYCFLRLALALSPGRYLAETSRLSLMEWIKNNTAPQARVLASLPLSAALHLQTGRAIAVHPIFEHTSLRTKAAEAARLYSRLEPEAACEIINNFQADYLILEQSYCSSQGESACPVADFFTSAERQKQIAAGQEEKEQTQLQNISELKPETTEQTMFCESGFKQASCLEQKGEIPGYLIFAVKPKT